MTASDFEIAVLANRIHRKNEIDAVPAFSPWIGLRFLLSRIAGRRSPFLCYPFEKPKKSLLILPDIVINAVKTLLKHIAIK